MTEEVSVIEVNLADEAIASIIDDLNDAVQAVNLAGCGCGCACSCSCGCGCASSVTGFQ